MFCCFIPSHILFLVFNSYVILMGIDTVKITTIAALAWSDCQKVSKMSYTIQCTCKHSFVLIILSLKHKAELAYKDASILFILFNSINDSYCFSLK